MANMAEPSTEDYGSKKGCFANNDNDFCFTFS
jgi:hypothetical protein